VPASYTSSAKYFSAKSAYLAVVAVPENVVAYTVLNLSGVPPPCPKFMVLSAFGKILAFTLPLIVTVSDPS